jgi:prophage antirepressor-like protein
METRIQIFNNPQFGEVRVAEIGGKTYFVGIDVARALGYQKPNDAITRHCRASVKHGVTDNLGRIQETTIISEGDIYRLAAKSELPGAEAFESWIFDEVLPSIRAHGMYATPNTVEKMLSDPDTAIRLLETIKEERQRRMDAEGEKAHLSLTVETQSRELKAQAPKVEYHDRVLNSKGYLTVNVIAAELGISHIKLNKLLCGWNVQYRQSDCYFLYSEYRDKGYTVHRPYPHLNSQGVTVTTQHMYWTESGKKFIIELYRKKSVA